MRLIAHACGPTIFPSNTVLSAREALKAGAEMVELDLQFTSDGKLAVFHDADLTKKFGRPEKCGEVSSETFCALRRREDPAVPGYLLEDFFRCDVGPILIHHSFRVLEETMDLVAEYGYSDRVYYGITQVKSLLRIRERDPKARVLGFIPSPDYIEEFSEAGANYVRLWERWLNEENASRVKRAGMELWVMTGGPETDYPTGRPTEEGLRSVMKWNPDGILINNIPFARSVLGI